jgi:transcriptional regulator with XRE-family HTH domain
MAKSSEESAPSPQAAPAGPPATFSRALGARCRELREERGWSQRELGSRLGILQSKLSKYESGTHLPSLRLLVRMANVFAVSTDYLLTGMAGPAPPLRDDRLLDRFRRLGAAGEEMRTIVLSMLDAILDIESRIHGGRGLAGAPEASGTPPPAPSPARPSAGQPQRPAARRRPPPPAKRR